MGINQNLNGLEDPKEVTKNLIAELRKYEEKIKGTTTMFDEITLKI